MKFAEHLSAHITPEWRKQYINYEDLKTLIYTAVEEMPSEEYVEPEEIHRHVAQFDDYFFRQCDGELKKINNFFAEKLAEAIRKFSGLKRELEIVEKPPGWRSTKSGSKIMISGTEPLTPKKLHDLKLAFTEFYLGLILLQNYQNLNFTGFRKILKKHDKLMKETSGAEWRKDHVETTLFYTNKDIERLIAETEQTFTMYLESGDRQKAMKRLRVPPLGDQASPWLTFKVGLFSGFFLILFIAVILGAVSYNNPVRLKAALKLYRGPLLLLEFLFLISINVYFWRTSGVNHVLIFELDPRNHLSEQHLIELAAIFGVGWTLSILCFLYSQFMSIPAYISPLSLVVILILFAINPMKTFRHEARFWLIRIIVRIVLAPFFFVQFADFWLGDQLNSLSLVVTDFYYIICFYADGDWLQEGETTKSLSSNFTISRVIVGCLPAWFRCAQCLRRYRDTKEAFPHLANAGKYGSSMVATIITAVFAAKRDYYGDLYSNPYFYWYFGTLFFSTVYSFAWDIKMDFGLLESWKPGSRFLREEMVYSNTAYYYFTMIEDFVLRFMWIIAFYVTEMKYVSTDVVVSVVAALEIFRRFVWNFFRLENEHLNNCGKFRAVRDISVAPIDASDPSIIVRMMDEEDFVVNRKKRKQINKKREDKRPLLDVQTGVHDNYPVFL